MGRGSSLDSLSIASGSIYPEFAQAVADTIGVPLEPLELKRHANSEQYGRFTESIRKKDLFVLQAHAAVGERSVDDAIAEQRQLISAARLASAKRITAVFPYMAYSRQDRKSKSGEPITAAETVDDFIRSGAKRLLTVDLHAGQIQGFTKRPYDHLVAAPVLHKWLQTQWLSVYGRANTVLVSPDVGRAKDVASSAEKLDIDLAIVDKRRSRETGKAEARALIGEVAGRHCMLYDDMIDGAGSVVQAAELLINRGAKSVSAIATHGILSSDAVGNIAGSPLERVMVTNSVPQAAKKLLIPNLEVIDIVPLFAKAIKRIHQHKSLSELFNGENFS